MSLDLYNEALSLWEGMFDHIGVEKNLLDMGIKRGPKRIAKSTDLLP